MFGCACPAITPAWSLYDNREPSCATVHCMCSSKNQAAEEKDQVQELQRKVSKLKEQNALKPIMHHPAALHHSAAVHSRAWSMLRGRWLSCLRRRISIWDNPDVPIGSSVYIPGITFSPRINRNSINGMTGTLTSTPSWARLRLSLPLFRQSE